MRPRLLQEAEAELFEAMLFYEDRQEGLGDDFLQCVTATMREIEANPRRFPMYEGKELKREIRRALVERFPFVILFETQPERTVVVAVAHASRQPGYWENR